MAQYLLSFDEAIDRKFIVTKNLNGQAKPGTMIHVLDCVPKGNGAHTVWYRVNETGQDFSHGFSSIKDFCSWARTDKILIRHYESLSRRDVMQYLKITNGGFTKLYLPVIIVLLILVWIALISVVGNALRNNFMLERKAFESVFMCDVELLTVNKGAKGISIIFGVAEENFKQVSRSLFVNLIR